MTNIFAQVGISTTSITPDPTSILELRSTTLGFLAPRMTTTQRDAITSPATGLLIYNTTTNQLNYFSGLAWQVVTGGGQSQLNGSGFVKASGTTISYDNSTYLTSAITSFSKTDNYGITSSVTNSTTTPNHTIGVDTTLISSRLWRQKGIDSLGAIIATKGTGTVTSVTSATGDATVATTTTTPVITIVSAPKLTTARNIQGVPFDGTANINPVNGTGFVKATGTTLSYDNSTYITNANVVFNNQANSYTAGMKQSFQSSATTAGFNFGGATADPSSLASGDMWFRTDTKKVQYYDGTTIRYFVGEALAQTLTNKDLTSGTNTFPTFNQNTTGSAATLTTARNIYGNSFNGSADLSGIIASTYGGTGNGFTKFSGPATSEKTFTLPNASANILTDNAAVTVAQGGTGVTSTTAYGVITGGTTTTGTLQNAGAGSTGQVLTSNGSSALPTWQMPTGVLVNVMFITSGTTYTPTTGTKSILIEMVGGGGGGGGVITKGSVSAGGGAGGYIKTYVTGISDASTYTIAIGGGGAGGIATGGANGTAGGATTFTTLAGSTPASITFTCNGGGGGTGSNDGATKITNAGGAGGTSTNGSISAGGAPGGWTISRGNSEGSSAGAGGSSQFGGGGVGVVGLFTTTDIAGNAGSGKGAGGGGGYAGSNTGAAGGAGSAGIIVIYEYK
jgi:hypothetical protein